jgi:hypothetical protein
VSFGRSLRDPGVERARVQEVRSAPLAAGLVRGLRRFLLRGLDDVRQEFLLIALTHNMLKLHRHFGAGAFVASG